MITTQKVSSLAFSLYDGKRAKKEELTKEQERYAIEYVFLLRFLLSEIFKTERMLDKMFSEEATPFFTK